MSSEPVDRSAPESAAASLSLPHALRALARETGQEIDLDDLCAAMGLAMMAIAVPEEPDVGCWPLYARDAFLIPAARLFGLTVREMHPPQAARGLRDAAEFRQHFDASYRPLILRALEHDQPVLAWQGWPGQAVALWGVIVESCNEGVGFRGNVAWPSEAPPCANARESNLPAPAAWHPRMVLERPPVQLYVVEKIERNDPPTMELYATAFMHADSVCRNTLVDRFGVLTGHEAYAIWLERAEALDQKMSSNHPKLIGHIRLASAVRAGLQSALRFLEPVARSFPDKGKDLVTPLMTGCREVEQAMTDLLILNDLPDGDVSEVSRDLVVNAVRCAQTSAGIMAKSIKLFAVAFSTTTPKSG